MDVSHVVIRRSPLPTVLHTALITAILMGAYAVFAFLFDDTLESVRQMRLGDLVGIDAMALLVVVILSLTYTFFRMMQWSNENYILRPGEIVHHRGVMRVRETRYALNTVETITFNQSVWGKLLQYGTIRLERPRSHDQFELHQILDPSQQLPLIQSVRQ